MHKKLQKTQNMNAMIKHVHLALVYIEKQWEYSGTEKLVCIHLFQLDNFSYVDFQWIDKNYVLDRWSFPVQEVVPVQNNVDQIRQKPSLQNLSPL